MYEPITAIYEKGVLRPLQAISLREHQKVNIILQSNTSWRREFKNLLEKIHSRTAKFSSKEIETDITATSHQIRKIREDVCKSAH